MKNLFSIIKVVMKIFPVDFFSIESRKSLPRLLNCLEREVDKKQGKVDYVSSPQFVGEIYDTGFKINKKIYSKNAFIPISHARIKETQNGTSIFIIMRPHLMVAIVMAMHFSFFSLIFTGQYMDDKLEPKDVLLFVAVYFAIIVSFHYNALKAKRSIKRILE